MTIKNSKFDPSTTLRVDGERSRTVKIQNCSLKFKVFLFVFWFLTFNFALLTFNLTNAQAQSLSLGIYPPLLEVTIKPGKSITQVYKIINNGDVDLVLQSKIVPFEPADELGGIQLLENQPQSLSLNWFSFQNADLNLGDQFVLKAQGDQQVVLKIKIPQNAPEDDYYLTLLFENQLEPLLGLSASQTQIKIGANILLTVSENGEPLKKAGIEEFSLENALFKIGSYQFIDSFSQPRFILRVKNTGRSFFKPMGTITTTGWLGQKFISDLLPENVLTNSVRAINCAPPDSPDRISPCQINTKFLLGSYQARVEFGLDKISSDYTAKINFIALPIKLILGILILVILFIVIKFSQKKFKISLDK